MSSMNRKLKRNKTKLTKLLNAQNNNTKLQDSIILYARVMSGSVRMNITPRQAENAFINEYKKINNCSVEIATNTLKEITDLSFETLNTYIVKYINCPIKKLLINEPIDDTYSTIKSSNNSHFKSPHSVKGHWRNQPYGPRNNPKYKKIWIEEFDKGIA